MSYPRITFAKVRLPQNSPRRSEWKAFDAKSDYLGRVYSLHTGGWCAVTPAKETRDGYSTRYEAAYRLLDA